LLELILWTLAFLAPHAAYRASLSPPAACLDPPAAHDASPSSPVACLTLPAAHYASPSPATRLLDLPSARYHGVMGEATIAGAEARRRVQSAYYPLNKLPALAAEKVFLRIEPPTPLNCRSRTTQTHTATRPLTDVPLIDMRLTDISRRPALPVVDKELRRAIRIDVRDAELR
jgi:hypothetical protein